MRTPVQPLFVFDGKDKPKWKRDKLSGVGDKELNGDAKRLLKLLGITWHNAPGEAEAECALLQKHGIVDAVLSEDGDTLMFGCTRALSKYSSESKSSPTPTHVNMYDVSSPGLLGKEGMILVAMMSGGDYYPQGVPGCGTKIASAAANAGFGKSLCQLDKSDDRGRQEWRESLMHELRTNESRFFSRKSPALALEMSKGDFPDMDILQYYKHPSVSKSLDGVSEKFAQSKDIYVEDLREFTREKLGWDFRGGAIWFMRQLAPALLVQNMLSNETAYANLAEGVSNRRTHWSADAAPELKVSYIPEKVVRIALHEEVEEPTQVSQASAGDETTEELGEDTSCSQPINRKEYDVTKVESLWILEVLARKTIPRLVSGWEEAEQTKAEARLKKAASKSKPRSTKSSKDASMPRGAIEGFVKYSKANANIKSSTSDKSPDKIPARQAQDVATPSPKERPRFHMPPTSPSPGLSKESSPARLSQSPFSNRNSGLPKVPRSPEKSTPGGTETILLPSSPPATLERTSVFAEDQSFEAVMPSTPYERTVSPRKSVPKMSLRTASQADESPSRQRQLTLDAFTVKAKTPRSIQEPIPGSPYGSEDDEGDLPSVPVLLSQESKPPKSHSKRLGSPKSRDRTPKGTQRRSKKQCSPDLTYTNEDKSRRAGSTQESPSKGKGRFGRVQVTIPPECEVVDLTQDD